MAKEQAIVLPDPLVLDGSTGLVPDGTALVLGLTWKVLLGQDLEAIALSESAKVKATHYSHAARSGSVGYARLKPDPKVAYLSAASLVAASHPTSTAFVALNVNETDCWICGVSNGSVLTGYDLVTTDVKLSRAMKGTFESRFGDAKFLGDADVEGLDDSYSWASIQELLGNAQLTSASTLKGVKKGLGQSLGKVPKPLIYLTAFGLLLFAGQKLALPLIQKTFASRQEAVAEDPELLWADALQSWIASNRVSASGSLNVVLNGLGDVPMNIAGWRPKSFECSWTPNAWKCGGEYRASNRLHTNEAFDEAKPKDWRVNWTLLQSAKVSFDIPTSAQPIIVKSLKTVKEHELNTASKVQKLAPLLTAGDKAMGAFALVAVPPPKLANGGAAPPSTTVIFPLVTKVALKSPVRTAAGMQDWCDEVAWSKVAVAFDLKRSPGINESAAVMELSGNIYAKP